MELNEDFEKAKASLKGMTPEQLSLAGMTCELMVTKAMEAIEVTKEAILDADPEKAADLRKDVKAMTQVACEMVTMAGEVVKLMLVKMDEDKHPLPEGLSLEESIAKVNAEVEKHVKELEAA